MQIHATVVSIDGHGVVLRGDSGSGKSDLALRLIGGGAVLVADDRCDLSSTETDVIASPPKEIAGLLEVRGLGVYRFEYRKDASVRLVVDMVEAGSIERLPVATGCDEWGPEIPAIRLDPFPASAVDKVRLALRQAIGDVDCIS